jgi:hypothetical protein
VSRRALLTGATVTGVAFVSSACSTGTPAEPVAADSTTPATAPGTTSESGSATLPDPDVGLVEAAIADERAILVYCTRDPLRHPPAVLRLIAAQQRQHVRALRAALTDPGRDTVATVPPRPPSVTAMRTTARSLLLGAQRQRRADALAAESGLLARLFASLSASHAVLAGSDDLS